MKNKFKQIVSSFAIISMIAIQFQTLVVLGSAETKISPTYDTYLNQYGTLTSSNSTITTFDVRGNKTRSAYMVFNLQALTGKNVLSAKIRIYMSARADGVTTARTIHAYSNDSYIDQNITNALIKDASFTLGTEITTFNVTNTLQWYDIDISNLVTTKLPNKIGIFLDETGNPNASTAMTFASNENTDATLRPYLSVQVAGELQLLSTSIDSVNTQVPGDTLQITANFNTDLDANSLNQIMVNKVNDSVNMVSSVTLTGTTSCIITLKSALERGSQYQIDFSGLKGTGNENFVGIKYSFTMQEPDLANAQLIELANSLLITAESNKTQINLNLAQVAIDKISLCKEKLALQKRADIIQNIIITNVGECDVDYTTQSFNNTIMDSEINEALGFQTSGRISSEIIDGNNVNILKLTYNGANGTGDGTGRFASKQHEVFWNANVNGLAEIKTSANVKSSNNPAYKLQFRYWGPEQTTQIYSINSDGIYLRDAGADKLVYSVSNGFQLNQWVDLRVVFNTTLKEISGIAPLSYNAYVGSTQIAKNFKMNLFTGITDYTNPPMKATGSIYDFNKSRMIFYMDNVTTPGSFEILVKDWNVKQLAPFDINSSSINYFDTFIPLDIQNTRIEFNQELDSSSIPQNILVNSDTSNAIATNVTVDKNVLNISTINPLDMSTTYTIKLDGIKDKTGRVFNRGDISFSTVKPYNYIDIKQTKTVATIGETVTPVAYGILSDGQSQEIPSSLLSVESSNPEIIAVSQQGGLIAQKRGSAVLTTSFKNTDNRILRKSVLVNVYYKAEVAEGFENNANKTDVNKRSGLYSFMLNSNNTANYNATEADAAQVWFYDDMSENKSSYMDFKSFKLGIDTALSTDKYVFAYNGQTVNTQSREKGWHQLSVFNNDISSSVYLDGVKITNSSIVVNMTQIEIALNGSLGDMYIDDLYILNCTKTKPQARLVTIAGNPILGSTLTGGYTYYDASAAIEANTEYGWIVDGQKTNKQSKNLNITNDLSNKTIQFYVIPSNEYGLLGTTYTSDAKNISSISTTTTGGGSSSGGVGSPNLPIVDNSTSIVDRYTDVKTHWAKQDLEYMVNNKYIIGKTENQISPDDNITRAEFVTLAVRVLNLSTTDFNNFTDNFNDVNKNDWYYNTFSIAKKIGIMSGYDNICNPNQLITREEMSKIAVDMLKYKNRDISNKQEVKFSDASNVDVWAYDYVVVCNSLNLMVGNQNNEFLPKNNATRAEAVTVMRRLLYNLSSEGGN